MFDRQAGLFNLGNTVRNAQKTQNKVLGEPKTGVASAGGWVDCADLASLSGRLIQASEARASITMAPKRKTPFCNTHEQDNGLKIVGRNATTAAVESVACQFCTIYGREEQGDQKRRATANVKYFAAPFRVDHYKSHMRVAHPERFAEYCCLAGDAKKEFFSMSVSFVNTLNAHCEKVGPFRFTIDAAIVDDLIVGMLCGKDEDERGRSSVIPRFFEKGCEGRVYNVTVRKAKQFVLCRRIVAADVSFHATSRHNARCGRCYGGEPSFSRNL
jgi:hypothetical protein